MKARERDAMHKIGKTESGNILVEMTDEEWEKLAQYRDIPENIGGALKKYRKEHGLSQGALAKKLGVSRNWISGIERGVISNKKTVKKYKHIVSIIS